MMLVKQLEQIFVEFVGDLWYIANLKNLSAIGLTIGGESDFMRRFGFRSVVIFSLFFMGCLAHKTNNLNGQENQSVQERPYHPKAADLVIQGSIHDLKGEHAEALLAYQEALLYDSTSASIYNAIAKDYLYLNKLESALQVLKKAIRVDPQFLESRELLATIYHRKGELDRAQRQYEAILAIDSTHVDAYLSLADVHLAQERPLEAAAIYQRLINVGEGSREIRMRLGRLYFREELYDQALEVFRRYVRDYTEEEAGYLAVGTVLMAQEDTAGAVAWYTKTLAENVDFDNVREELAQTYVAQKAWQAAIDVFEEAVRRDSSDVTSHLRLGDLYFQKGDTAQALAMYQDVTEMHPEEWRGYFKVGSLYFSQGKYEKSLQYLRKTTELNDALPDAWFRLGLAEQELGNLDAAEKHLRKAQELVPDHPMMNFYLGALLFQKRAFDEAIEYYKKSLQASPDNPMTLGSLAAAYDELNQPEKSEEFYEKALELDPDNPVLLNNFSYSLSERGERLQEALEMVKSALEVDPENGAFLDTIGWVYYQLGEYDKALEYIKKSLEQRDDSAEVWEHLGDVYHKLGQHDAAVEAWRKARELEPDRESVLIKLEATNHRP